VYKIDCCKYNQRPSERKEIKSKIGGCRQFYLFLDCCVKCGRRTLKLITVNEMTKTASSKRIDTKKIDSFLKNNVVIRDLSTISLQRVPTRPIMIVSEGSRKMARIRDPK